MIRHILLAIFFVSPLLIFSQELNCRVSVTYSQEILDFTEEDKNNMENTIRDFMNSYKWTDIIIGDEEKIEMSVKLSITQKKSTASYVASFQILANRPVYNSTYTSQLFSHIEEGVPFTFEEFEVIEFDENAFTSNLSSVLAFYTYIVLGLDFDSFSKNGGNAFYQQAQNVVNAAQGQADKQWLSMDKEGRYWLIENILNSSYRGFRDCMYTYHRLGMDIMSKDVAAGRKEILVALNELYNVYKAKPNSLILTMFFFAKSEELQDIFSEGQASEISEAVTLLKKMDPGNASDYEKMLKK